METSLPCHSPRCGQRAVQSCVVCGWDFCGEHLLRASFLGSAVPVHVVLNVCPLCLEHAVQQQHVRGRDLTHWRKMR